MNIKKVGRELISLTWKIQSFSSSLTKEEDGSFSAGSFTFLLSVFIFLFILSNSAYSRMVRNGINIPHELIYRYMAGGEVSKELVNRYPNGWMEHIDKSKTMINDGAEGVYDKSLVSIWGAGSCIEIPLKSLASEFSSVSLEDLDSKGMILAKKRLPEGLQSKVEIEEKDLTSVTTELILNSKKIVEESNTVGEAVVRIKDFMKNMTIPEWNIEKVEKSDYIVFSNVLSALMFHEYKYIEELLEGKFGDLETSNYLSGNREWEKVKESFRNKTVRSMVDKLAKSLKPGGKVYIADTIVRKKGAEKEYVFDVTSLEELFKHKFSILQKETWVWKPQGEDGAAFEVEGIIVSLP